MAFPTGKRKCEVPKVEGAAFSGAELVDLAEIWRFGAFAVEHTYGKPTGDPWQSGYLCAPRRVLAAFPTGKRKCEVPKVKCAAFSGAERVDLAEIW